MGASAMNASRAGLATVTIDNAERAKALTRQMNALGLSGRELATQSGVARGTVSKALEGKAARGTYERLEKFLSDLDREMTSDAPKSEADEPNNGLVEFRLSGNFGVDVVVRGPVSDLAELEASVGRLLSQMGESRP